MSFAAEKEKPVTDRFMLVRLEPARYVNDDLAASGSLYSMSFPYPVSKVERNGVQLTNDGTTPNADGEWLYNESTRVLQIYSSSAPSGSVIFVVYYYIFITNDSLKVLPQNPESAESVSNPLREWQPRLNDDPRIKQSVGNQLYGVFSIESTSIDVSNIDNDFQQYLTFNDSFRNKECAIWVGIGSIENLAKAYVGLCQSLRLGSQSVSISVNDSFSALREKCLHGDTADEAYLTSAGFSDVDPSKVNTPIPMVYGPFSRWQDETEYVPFVATGGGRIELYNIFTEDTLRSWNEAVCIDYDPDVTSTSGNRTWALCRVPAAGFRATNFGSPTSITNNGTDIELGYSVAGWAALDVELYDFCSISQSSTTGYFQVTHIDAATRTLTLYCDTNNVASGFSVGSMTIGNVSAPQIIVQATDGTEAQPFWGKDYSWIIEETSGGNYFGKIQFTSTFETALSYGGTIHPRNHRVFYRVRGDVNGTTHSVIVQSICEDVGLTVDSTSFTAAQSALDKRCIFQIPQFDENDFGTCLSYIQLILESTLGILYLNDDFTVAYKLLDTPSGSEVTSEDLYLRDSLRIELDYEDIVTFLIAYNGHHPQPYTLVYTEESSYTELSDKARYLHGVYNVVRFRHVLNDISTRLADILTVRGNRRAIYRFKTATKHLDSQIGDDMQLESSALLAGEASKDLKILSLDKSLDDTEVEATDLEGL